MILYHGSHLEIAEPGLSYSFPCSITAIPRSSCYIVGLQFALRKKGTPYPYNKAFLLLNRIAIGQLMIDGIKGVNPYVRLINNVLQKLPNSAGS